MPSATCFKSKSSLLAVWASAGMTQQKSRCANVWRAAAAAPHRVIKGRRGQWVGIRGLLMLGCGGPWERGYVSFHTAKRGTVSRTRLRLMLDHPSPSAEGFVANFAQEVM